MAYPNSQDEYDLMGYAPQKQTMNVSPTSWLSGLFTKGVDALGLEDFTVEDFGNIAGGLGGLASSWMALQGLGLAKDQFKFQKDFAIKNYDNQASAYNRELADMAQSRNPNGKYDQWYGDNGSYINKYSVSNYG